MFCNIYILTCTCSGNFQVFRFCVLLFNFWDSKQQIISNSKHKQFALNRSVCFGDSCPSVVIVKTKLLYFVLLTKIWRLTLIQPFEPSRFYVDKGSRVWSNRTQFATSPCSASLYLCQDLLRKKTKEVWYRPIPGLGSFQSRKREDLLPGDSTVYVKEKNCIKEPCLEEVVTVLLLFLV